MVSTEDWTKSAMSDGEMVAEILVTLKEAKVNKKNKKNPTVNALRWGIRRLRSRCPRKEGESRCSPSTPLSWSGGGSSSSPSGYLDGYEATSRRIISVGSRSKVLVTTDLDCDVKRLQKKKDSASLGIENKNSKRLKMDTKNHSQNMAEKVEEHKGNFLLPDLNIMPCEEENGDQCSAYGMESSLYGIRITS